MPRVHTVRWTERGYREGEEGRSQSNVPSVPLEQRSQGLQALGSRRGKAVLSSAGAHHNAVDGCTGLIGPAGMAQSTLLHSAQERHICCHIC